MNPSQANTVVAVFSYNRGAYLRNCVASIERHLPGTRVWVFDDASQDPDTVATLGEIGRRHRVERAERHEDQIYLGGLHANMNRALDLAEAEGVEYLFLVQDDQQFVRPVDEAFFGRCHRIFASGPRIVQISAMFFKGHVARALVIPRIEILAEPGCYSFGLGIGDNGLLHLERLRARGFRFATSETDSGTEARRLGFVNVLHRDPVLMYTPWPGTIRPRSWKVRLLLSLNEWGIRAGCNPYLDMTADEIAALLARPIEDLPMAEFHLRSVARLRLPWWYSEIFDLGRLKNPLHLITLRWIFDGPEAYREGVKAIDAADLERMRRKARG